MECIENVIYAVKGSSTGAHKNFPMHYGVWEENFLKSIVINLPSTKDIEINVFHSYVKNHVPYTGPHKIFLIYYGLCLETAGKVFSIVSHSLILNFNALCDAIKFKDITQC